MIKQEYIEDSYLKENSKEYNYNLKDRFRMCTFCRFHRGENRTSKYLKRSWKNYRSNQYKTKGG